MKKYYIDEKILSLLFKITDKKVSEETFALFADILMRFHDELSREYLLEKGINAVSYTHLDVYKRQASNRRSCGS